MEKNYPPKKENLHEDYEICLEPKDILKEYYPSHEKEIDGGFFDNGPWPWENWTDFNNVFC